VIEQSYQILQIKNFQAELRSREQRMAAVMKQNIFLTGQNENYRLEVKSIASYLIAVLFLVVLYSFIVIVVV
jgi:hypothetical protein